MPRRPSSSSSSSTESDSDSVIRSTTPKYQPHHENAQFDPVLDKSCSSQSLYLMSSANPKICKLQNKLQRAEMKLQAALEIIRIASMDRKNKQSDFLDIFRLDRDYYEGVIEDTLKELKQLQKGHFAVST